MSKTLRQFQVRDDLWARVDALAKRRGISTDDVVGAALMQLFKSKTKKEGESSVVTPAPGPPPAGAPAGAPGRPASPAGAPAVARPAGPPPGLPRPPGPPAPATRPPTGPPTPSSPPVGSGIPAKAATMAPRLPRPASVPVPAAAPAPTPAPSLASPSLAPKGAPTLPRPQAPAGAPTRLPPPATKPTTQQARPLYLMFENEWFEVDKEEYVIGRGQKFSDLPIKDANISRRHCSIVRRGGDYFIKDLGSTNGIEFEGTRVDNHKIVEGSVYFLCDHELRFSFTPPSTAG